MPRTLTAKIKIADSLRDQRHGTPAEDDTQRHAQHRAHRTQHQRFAQDEGEDLPLGSTQRAHNTDDLPALHHAECDRVVNQKQADDQGQHAHRLQVDLEGGDHLIQSVCLP